LHIEERGKITVSSMNEHQYSHKRKGAPVPSGRPSTEHVDDLSVAASFATRNTTTAPVVLVADSAVRDETHSDDSSDGSSEEDSSDSDDDDDEDEDEDDEEEDKETTKEKAEGDADGNVPAVVKEADGPIPGTTPDSTAPKTNDRPTVPSTEPTTKPLPIAAHTTTKIDDDDDDDGESDIDLAEELTRMHNDDSDDEGGGGGGGGGATKVRGPTTKNEIDSYHCSVSDLEKRIGWDMNLDTLGIGDGTEHGELGMGIHGNGVHGNKAPLIPFHDLHPVSLPGIYFTLLCFVVFFYNAIHRCMRMMRMLIWRMQGIDHFILNNWLS